MAQRIERVNGKTLVKPRMSVNSSNSKMKMMTPEMSDAPTGAWSIWSARVMTSASDSALILKTAVIPPVRALEVGSAR
jgi:hypothetical protein